MPACPKIIRTGRGKALTNPCSLSADEVDEPVSPFEKLTVAEVTNRLQPESHFSFHEYDSDGRISRHYLEDAMIDGDVICPNGNVELVHALLAGRNILRAWA